MNLRHKSRVRTVDTLLNVVMVGGIAFTCSLLVVVHCTLATVG